MARPRPVTIHYPGGAIGHSSSVRNAIVCATRRLPQDTLKTTLRQQANIVYEKVHVADVIRAGNSVHITWLRGRLAY